MKAAPRLLCAAALAVLAAACDQPQMRDQPKLETYEASGYFEDGTAARRPPAGTVAREAGAAASSRPTITLELLKRGREHFDAVCAPCHGYVGNGEGMVVQRGFPAPPSLHSPRLRAVPDSHIYQVITEGYGIMYSYADRLSPGHRWAVIAYIRALQLSQHAPVARLPKALQNRLAREDAPW